MTDPVAAALAVVRERTEGPAPEVAIVLGSGLRGLADALEARVAIAYQDLPGFPRPSVVGHGGELLLGALAGRRVAVMTGRTHYYETGRADGMRGPLAVLRALGCETLVLTNAAASLRDEAGPGSLVLITDHINFGGTNPLIGPLTGPSAAQGDGNRFVDMIDCYDPALRAAMLAGARAAGVALHEGVYMWFSGPSFETPAEIRAARALGADAVGMSTVPEAIIARQLGFRVLAVSAITNMGAGLETGPDDQPLDHAHTLETAARTAGDLTRLLNAFLRAPEAGR